MKKLFRMGAALATAAGLTACVPTTPALDANFGQSLNLAKAAQTINPEASANTDPVSGMDGKAANAALSNYHESFRTPTLDSSWSAAAGGVITGGTAK